MIETQYPWKQNSIQLDFVRELSNLNADNPEDGYLDMPVCIALDFALKSAKTVNKFFEEMINERG